MEWSGNGMKVVESLWNGMIENCYGMGWDGNGIQDFGPLLQALKLSFNINDNYYFYLFFFF
jgi:hypothetical protein